MNGNQPSRPNRPPSTEEPLEEMARHQIRLEQALEAKGGFINSLGMTFLPVPGTEVSFCAHETRVKDYAAYGAAKSGVDMAWKDVGYEGHRQMPDHPVVNVSWEDARAFCQWLSQKEGKTYRLPTDHEWSVAVGIGDFEDPKLSPKEKSLKLADVFPWGSIWPPPSGAGNFAGNETKILGFNAMDGYNDPFPFTAPVGYFELNHHGNKDLSGNVWEWCEDKYDPSSSGFVLRGGSWLNYDRYYFLSSYRFSNEASFRGNGIGFRCVLAGAGKEAR